jgi:hypothetical protein
VRRRLPACGVPAAGAGYGLPVLAQKVQGGVCMLTEGLVRAGWLCRGVGVGVRRRRRGGARGEG